MTVKTAGKILFFPLAALALAAVWSALHQGGPDASPAPADGFPRVKWQGAQPHVEAGHWVLVDARDEEQFQAQHIPGAVSLPAHSYPEMLQFFTEDHGTDKTVVVYCGTEDCDLSLELATRLRSESGCKDVRILEGGFLAWRRSQQ